MVETLDTSRSQRTTLNVLLVGVVLANLLAAAVLVAAGDDPLSDWVSPWLFVALLAVSALVALRCLVLVRRLTGPETTKDRPDSSS